MVDIYPDEEAARARRKEFFEPSGNRHKEWCKKIVPIPMLPPEDIIYFQNLVFGPTAEETLLDMVSKEMEGHLDYDARGPYTKE